MGLEIEYELNRKWVYGKEQENIIGETNFVVPGEWFKNTFKKLNEENRFVCQYNNFDIFLETYEPETDGELIYKVAIKDNALSEDLGVVIYN